MKIKKISKDFVRELSVWQQEIEVESNHNILPYVLGIRCSVFFFFQHKGITTAYRLQNERNALPKGYEALTHKKNFAKKLFAENSPIVDAIKKGAKQFSRNPKKFGITELYDLRNYLLMIWPAYLYGYNILRYKEKNLLIPKTAIEKNNFIWAKKLHYRLEGIYDTAEILLGTILKPKLKKVGLESASWRNLEMSDIALLLVGAKKSFKQLTHGVIDERGIHRTALSAYAKKKGYRMPIDNVKPAALLTGTIASPGIATGRVRILHKSHPERFKLFKKGEILVAMTTSPSFIPAIKKAAAVITDFGGLTSHAAIAARELKKPCIVGTRSATTTLKDGDMVKVDAERGSASRVY